MKISAEAPLPASLSHEVGSNKVQIFCWCTKLQFPGTVLSVSSFYFLFLLNNIIIPFQNSLVTFALTHLGVIILSSRQTYLSLNKPTNISKLHTNCLCAVCHSVLLTKGPAAGFPGR